MKKIVALLLLTLSLNAAGFWTLSGLEKANIYVKNDVATLKPDTIKSIKIKMSTMLNGLGLKVKAQDSPTLMIALEEIENEGTHYVYVRIGLGEEVQTFRADKSATFSLTYFANDFIEVDASELDSEVLESADFLLSQFKEHFEDDKE